ncbi:MAG: hypothetical protein ABIG71_00645, partial [Candidatus Uhrbacteria bacterium]
MSDPKRVSPWVMLAMSLLVFLAPLSSVHADQGEDDLRCWLRAECNTLNDSTTFGAFWEGRPTECGRADLGFCYPNKPIDISVHIPGLDNPKSVATLGEYIGAIYRWIIPLGAVAAVIVIMIGGGLW